MVNNKKLFFTIIIFIISLFGTSLFAQEEDSYYLKESEEGLIFVQKFSWDVIDGALNYKFTIEQKYVEERRGLGRRNKDEIENEVNADGYILIDDRETENSFVELSLPSGSYRYKITVYNFLGYAEYETDWFSVDIYKAYQPEVRDITPRNLFLEEVQNGIFTVTGVDLREGAEYYLRAGTRKLKATVIEQDNNNRHVKLQFDVKSIDAGIYTLNVVNVGGLESSISPITVKFKKPTDFDISVGYAPFLVLYDSTIAENFGTNFFPIGANLRMSFFPLKFKAGYFGISLSASGTYVNNQKPTFSVSTHIADAYVNLAYQKCFLKNNRLHLDAHAGAGLLGFLGTQFKFPHNIKSEQLWSLSICATAGVSFQFYILNRLYIEAGVDFVQPFIFDMVMGYVKPIVSVGWQF